MLRRAALLLAVSLGLSSPGQDQRRLAPQASRHAPSDIELITHDSAHPLFLSRAYLASLPQVSFPLKPDGNFPDLPAVAPTVTGVDLGDLLTTLDAVDPIFAPNAKSDALIAICRDGYASPFPRKAILDHHPVLILKIDGLPTHAWALKHHTYDPGPYFVTYANFVPSFRLLAHEDFPQHPAEVIRLKIIPESLLSAIAPRIFDLAPSNPISIGFNIAQQNCIRCHNSGEVGGTKAGLTWQHIAEVAKARPDYFAKWVHNPQSIDPKATMYPNLKYDQPTLDALTRYFQALAP